MQSHPCLKAYNTSSEPDLFLLGDFQGETTQLGETDTLSFLDQIRPHLHIVQRGDPSPPKHRVLVVVKSQAELELEPCLAMRYSLVRLGEVLEIVQALKKSMRRIVVTNERARSMRSHTSHARVIIVQFPNDVVTAGYFVLPIRVGSFRSSLISATQPNVSQEEMVQSSTPPFHTDGLPIPTGGPFSEDRPFHSQRPGLSFYNPLSHFAVFGFHVRSPPLRRTARRIEVQICCVGNDTCLPL